MFPPRPCSPPSSLTRRLSGHSLPSIAHGVTPSISRGSALGLSDWPRPHEANMRKNGPYPTVGTEKASATIETPSFHTAGRNLGGRKSKRHLRPAQSSSSLNSVAEEGRSGETVRTDRPAGESSIGKPTDCGREALPRLSKDAVIASRKGELSRPPSRVGTSGKTDKANSNPPERSDETQVQPSIPSIPSNLSTAASAPVVDEHGRPIAVPTRRASQPQQPTAGLQIHRPDRSYAASSVQNGPKQDVMADEWDTELVRGAQRIDLSGARELTDTLQNSKGKKTEQYLANERVEQRRKDAEWERSGLWLAQRDTAREAEERTRREAGRAIGRSSQLTASGTECETSIPAVNTKNSHPHRSKRCHFHPRWCPPSTPSFPRVRLHSAQPA